MAHAALPALVPTPPKCEMLPLLPTPCVAVVLPKPLAKPSRAGSDERWEWDARKTMTGLAARTDQSSASSMSSPCSSADSVWSSARRRGSASRKIATTPPKPGRADSDERWDARKTMTILAASTDHSSASSTSSPRSTADSVWSSNRRRGSASRKIATTPPKPGRADSDERWDARKTMTGLASSTDQSSASSSPRSTSADRVRGSAQRRGSSCKNATAPSKPGRADSAVRWGAHKKVANPASSSSSSSSSGTSSLASSSAERWDVHKKHRPPQATELLDDDKSSTGSNDIDTDQEEIVWKPRAIYAEPCFISAAPAPSMLPMPTAFLLRIA
ncbi:hypothetical protein Zm00014a_027569 [Zea mays]|nr:hypothetical protein Zm00014a_027569 [Zea mays]